MKSEDEEMLMTLLCRQLIKHTSRKASANWLDGMDELAAVANDAGDDTIRGRIYCMIVAYAEVLREIGRPPDPEKKGDAAYRAWSTRAAGILLKHAIRKTERAKAAPEGFTHKIPEPLPLQKYIMEHTARGPCTCGRCADAVPDREKHQPTGHTADMIFWKMKIQGEASRAELRALIKAHHMETDLDLFDGDDHSFIEIGNWLGCQELALRLMGLGALLGLWDLLTPRSVLGIDVPDLLAKAMAARGLVTVRAKGIQTPDPATCAKN